MEGIAGKGGWNSPLMMRLVKPAVDTGVMLAPVNPVDTTIREEVYQEEVWLKVVWAVHMI